MRSYFAYWDAVCIILLTVIIIGLLGMGAGAFTWWMASSFSPAMLGCGAGCIVSILLLIVFFRSLRD